MSTFSVLCNPIKTVICKCACNLEYTKWNHKCLIFISFSFWYSWFSQLYVCFQCQFKLILIKVKIVMTIWFSTNKIKTNVLVHNAYYMYLNDKETKLPCLFNYWLTCYALIILQIQKSNEIKNNSQESLYTPVNITITPNQI